MRTRLITTLAMAAGAAAIGFAPVAGAAPTGCAYTGGAVACQTPGNVQITAQPGQASADAAQLQYRSTGRTASSSATTSITTPGTITADSGRAAAGPR
nr:hypothetical protein [Mycolicibacterium malmesburyense]CRL69814.1 hypothetical protein CPGR_01355 [Mycolicibacterium malmesburyense]